MGSDYIDLKFDGKMSQADIEIKLAGIRLANSNENGHRDGYSGDWQTISSVRFVDGVKASYKEAATFIQENAQKWDYGIAVKFEAIEGKLAESDRAKAKLEKLNAKVSAAKTARQEEGLKVFTKITEAKAENVNCQFCHSRYARKFLKERRTVECLICSKRLVGVVDESRLAKLDAKIQIAEAAVKEFMDAERAKAPKVVKWLVGGWAAC